MTNPVDYGIAIDEKSQIEYYREIVSEYIYFMTKYDINTIFIYFDRMITDKKYLFDKLKTILDEKILTLTYFV